MQTESKPDNGSHVSSFCRWRKSNSAWPNDLLYIFPVVILGTIACIACNVGLAVLEPTITPKEPDFVNNIEEEWRENPTKGWFYSFIACLLLSLYIVWPFRIKHQQSELKFRLLFLKVIIVLLHKIINKVLGPNFFCYYNTSQYNFPAKKITSPLFNILEISIKSLIRSTMSPRSFFTAFFFTT